MEGDELLRVFHRHRLAGFEVEDHLVFGAVILEHAENILHARHAVEEAEEESHADQAVHHVHREAAVQRWDHLCQVR